MWSHIFLLGSLPRRRPPEFIAILIFEFCREATAASVPGLLCQSSRCRPENVSVLISLMLQCWRRTGHLPLFSSHPGAFDSSTVPTPGNLPSKAKKNANARGQPGGWGRWAQLELTDALQWRQQVNWLWIRDILIEFMERFLSGYSRSESPFDRQ